ncbi:DUF542 domain-containing protein [Mitsuokella multacida]|uniref:Cell division protein n=1 Tax=Mitsuokella multacida TaxID=52226 RepID=A0A414NUL3_9FIRM|nr:DUF542 domain-containing protein [Mitsuokella multacida]RHF50346.1 cell division protein [Mitsuokella multacida]
MITKDMTLADVVKAHPNTIGFLNNLHLDYCCGGHDAISIAVREKGLAVEKFLADLNAVAARPTKSKDVHADIESFKDLTVLEMLDDLEATHHVTDRQLMAETEQLLNKILIVHYPHHGEMLTRLHHLYAGLKAELEEHFAKEEQLVFPLMRQHPHPDEKTLALVQELENEHTGAGDIIKEIQELTDNFTPPADACPTFRRTYTVMEELFDDVFIHIFKENSIAFPEYAEQQ